VLADFRGGRFIPIQPPGGRWCAPLAGLIHRDIKPANIMGPNDAAVKVLSHFAAGQSTDSAGPFARWGTSVTGMLVGTVYLYFSRRRRAEMRSMSSLQIFLLSARFLYEAVTGQCPSRLPSLLSPKKTCTTSRCNDPPPPSRVQPRVPVWLEQSILRWLRKQVAERSSRLASTREHFAVAAVGATAAGGAPGRPGLFDRCVALCSGVGTANNSATDWRGTDSTALSSI